MLNITPQAQQEIASYIASELTEGEFLRIARAYQCGGSRFQISVDTDQTVFDVLLPVCSFYVVVDKACEQLLQSCELDFCEDGFVFTDDIGGYC